MEQFLYGAQRQGGGMSCDTNKSRTAGGKLEFMPDSPSFTLCSRKVPCLMRAGGRTPARTGFETKENGKRKCLEG